MHNYVVALPNGAHFLSILKVGAQKIALIEMQFASNETAGLVIFAL
jgi:hypothetical protein